MPDPATVCFPDPPAFDPWLDLYFAAILCADCFEARLGDIELEPLDRRGDAWAIAARAFARIGRPAEALRAWDRAQPLGGPEVDALAIWLCADGLRRAESRAEAQTDPGLRADAWCDVAALRLTAREPAHARRAIGHALAACPDHGEAAHWLRLLDLPDVGVAVSRVQQRPSRRGDRLAVRDTLALLPMRSNGWVSPERADRRALFEATAPAPAGSALARLRAAGVPQSYLATDLDWARVPERHPLVPAELELDRLVHLVDEGRAAAALGREAWDGARASGDALRVDDVAQLLCALSTRAPDLLPLGAAAAAWLVDTHAAGSGLFAGYAAWFAAKLRSPDAAQRASAVLTGPVDDLTWRLAVGALFVAGAEVQGRAEVERALLDPARRALAQSLRRPGAGAADFAVAVSPRLNRRELAVARTVALA